MAYVYSHIRLDNNNIFYIGIGKDNSKYERAYSTKNRNKHWIGINNTAAIKVDILYDNISWEEACKKERDLILIHGRRDLKEGTLVNMTDGGDGQINMSAETIEKIRATLSGKKLSDRHKNNIRKTCLERKINAGKSHTIESKLKMSKGQKGHIPWNKGHKKEKVKKEIVESQKDKILKLLLAGKTNNEIFILTDYKKKTISFYKWALKNN